MSYYTDSLTEIDLPFHEDFEEYFEFEESNEYGHFSIGTNIHPRMIALVGSLIIMILTSSLFVFSRNSSQEFVESETSTGVGTGVVDSNQSLNARELSLTSNLGIAPIFTPEIQHWAKDIIRWSQEHDLDPNAVATIMQIESCGDPNAVSIAGAQGLFQVMPFHFGNGENMQDPDTNARRGLNFLNEQLRFTDGNLNLSFAGYNGGYAASGGNYENWAYETQRYYQWATGIYEDAKAGNSYSETLNTWLEAGGAAGCQRAANRLGL